MPNAWQKIYIKGQPTIGTFNMALTAELSPPIDSITSAELFQAALEQLSDVGTGNVLVKPQVSNQYVFMVEFTNAKGNMDLPLLTVDDSNLPPNASIIVQTRSVGGPEVTEPPDTEPPDTEPPPEYL